MRDKFLILGSRGLLGTNLKKFFKKKNIKYITYKRNIKTNFQVLKKTILKNKTKVIINLSALADVDLCEKNKSRANEINYIFVKKLCEIVTEIKDLHIIHISTDQIYSKFSKNYENKFKAINYYSKTKILAEKELKKVSATIFRTNFFGLGNHKAKMSFSDWIFNNLKKKNYFEMADDIYFSPIRIETLCELIYKACKLKISGIYNVGSKKAFSKYSFAIKDLSLKLGLSKMNLTIEGFDISHHGGQHAVASAVRFSSHGPEKKNYRLFNIPKELSGNDIGSMRHVLERRIKRANVNPLPDIILVDGGKLQLEAALSTFNALLKKPPMILSIVKGSKRVRSTETILSKVGIIEMSKESAGFVLLQQIRDESHRFAIKNNRKKKNKSIKRSSLDNIKGLGPKRKRNLMNAFKSVQAIKIASANDLSKVPGISIKLAKEINLFYTL